jgi:hypothetical protein
MTVEEQEMPSPTEEVDRTFVRTLRALRNVGDDREQRTQLLRRIAALSVDMREAILDEAGNPDWAGRTHAYREHMRDMYAKAGMTAEEKSNVQAAVRYHVSSLVRERLTDGEVEALGLVEHSSQEKARVSRNARSAQLRLVREETAPAETSPLRLLALALIHLERVKPAAISHLDDEERALAQATLEQIMTRVRTLTRGRHAG